MCLDKRTLNTFYIRGNNRLRSIHIITICDHRCMVDLLSRLACDTLEEIQLTPWPQPRRDSELYAETWYHLDALLGKPPFMNLRRVLVTFSFKLDRSVPDALERELWLK